MGLGIVENGGRVGAVGQNGGKKIFGLGDGLEENIELFEGGYFVCIGAVKMSVNTFKSQMGGSFD